MLLPSQVKKPSHWGMVILSLLIFIVGVSVSIGLFIDHQSESDTHAIGVASTIAKLIPVSEVADLSGMVGDLQKKSYEHLKTSLASVQQVNENAEYVYLAGLAPNGDVFIFDDSELPSSRGYSKPGEVYYGAPVALRSVFATGLSTSTRYRNHQGSWIYSFAPVTNASGTVIAVLGVNTDAAPYTAEAYSHSASPFIGALFAICILIVIQILRMREYKYFAQKAESVSISSHEVRTPMTGIRWALESFLQEYGDKLDDQGKMLITKARDNCVLVIVRINEMLSAPIIETARALKKEPIAVYPIARDIVDSLALSAQSRGVTIKIDPTLDETITISGDKQQLHHVFFNLLTNAIKYTHENTEVLIRYQHKDSAHYFSFTDHGAGISEEDQKHIFEGYYRSHDAVESGQQGTGLGLYLVRKAVQLHGGSISIETEGGKGSTFVVKLPE